MIYAINISIFSPPHLFLVDPMLRIAFQRSKLNLHLLTAESQSLLTVAKSLKQSPLALG